MTYYQHIIKVIDYIESNLTHKIKVEDIANHSYISPQHLQNIFFSSTGTSIGEYIKKRRLTQSAIALIDTENSIIDIGMEYCYDSQQSFTKAFRKLFKITPAKYRVRGEHAVYCYRFPIRIEELEHYLSKKITLTPEIIDTEKITLIGIEGISSFEKSTLFDMWNIFANKYKQQEDKKYYCVCTYSPNIEINNISEKFEFKVFIGVEKEEGEMHKDFKTYEIPKGKYAVFTIKDTWVDGYEPYRYIFGEWLPNSCYQVNGNFDYEMYNKFFDINDKSFEGKIFVPVK